jgi:hypothetical protein
MFKLQVKDSQGNTHVWRFAEMDEARLAFYRTLNDAERYQYVEVTLADVIHGWANGDGMTD